MVSNNRNVTLGLKLWSTNKNYIPEAQRLYDNEVYQYIELFSEPETFDQNINLWKELGIPFIIHAAHFTRGLNFARPENAKQNEILTREALAFADALNAKTVIFHPGGQGDIKETVRQLKIVYDPRIVIENKPYWSYDGKFICNGYTPEDISFVLNEVGAGFCLDIAHAIYAANALKINQVEYLKKFLALKPRLFHVADGDWNGWADRHEHLGNGSFDFDQICSLLPNNAIVSIECKHDSKDHLSDFEQDVRFFKKALKLKQKTQQGPHYV